MNNDFTSQISAFKAAGAEIVTGIMIPPDFATFWSQAAQQGFKPKIVTIGKALLFPSVDRSRWATAATASRPRSGGRRTIPSSRASPARARSTRRRLHEPPPSGSGRSRSASSTRCSKSRSTCSSAPKNRRCRSRSATRSRRPNYQSIVGPDQVEPASRSRTSPRRRWSAGQWQRKNDKFDLVIVENKTAPNIPLGGKLKLLS